MYPQPVFYKLGVNFVYPSGLKPALQGRDGDIDPFGELMQRESPVLFYLPDFIDQIPVDHRFLEYIYSFQSQSSLVVGSF